MTARPESGEPRFGSHDLALPDGLREPLAAHLDDLRAKYLARGWGNRVGFGTRPALVVIDLVKGTSKNSSFPGVVDLESG